MNFKSFLPVVTTYVANTFFTHPSKKTKEKYTRCSFKHLQATTKKIFGCDALYVVHMMQEPNAINEMPVFAIISKPFEPTRIKGL